MCALALALPLLPGPATAHQLTSVKQVSNTGQTDGTYQIFTQDWAQAFTTGSHADGYTLTSLVLSLFVQHSSALNQSYSVTIHAANSSGRPGVKLGTLTNPTLSVSTSFQLKTFTAAAGIVLDPDTTYFVVVDVSGSGSNNLRIRPTSSNNEDSGKAAGWSIANNRLFRTSTSTGAWSSNTNALKVAIHGHENKSHWRYMNNPPVFTGTPYEWVNAVPGGLSSLNISESDFSDPDGHALTYSISWSRDDTAEPGFIVWNTDIGRLFFRAKSSCDLAALTPRPSRTFDTVATITATDPYGETVVGATRAYRTSWSCATSGNSDPYVSTQIPDQSAAVAAPYTYTIPANTFFDSQFDTLDYTATRTDGSALPAWLKFDAATRTFSGTPGESDIGTVAVKVAVNDGHWTDDGHGNRIYGTASDTFTMEVSSLAHLPAPTLSAATLSARTLVAQLAFEGQPLNPRHCPEPGAWTFKVDGVGYNPYSVACRTDSVTLRLADSVVPPIRNHHKVTLSYDRHRAGGHGIDGSLRSVYGASVVNFSDRAVTLTEAADVRRPTATGATVDGRNLTLFFSEPLNAGSAPAGSAFTVSGGRTGTGTASIDGATVRVTLDSAVSEGETLTVRYTRPSANPLRDRAGLRASPFRRAANNITGPPGFLRAAVNGKTLVVTFDEPLDAGAAPAGSAFRVTATPSGGTSRTIAGTGTASIDGAKVTLTLASAVAYGDTVTVRYTRPSANPLRDLVGDRVASFSGQAVTNNTAAQAAPQGGLWSGSLTLQNLSGVGVVGQRLGCSVMPDCASGLTSDSFTHNGETYRIREFVFARSDPEGAWDVYVTLDKAWPQRLRHEGSLYVGATQLSLAGASYTVGGTRVGWSGTAVRDIVRGGTASLGLTLPFEGAQANNVAASSVDSGASVSDVAVVSDPGADDTYGDEDEIRIRVTFDAAVDVDTAGGKPRLKIKMDPNYGEKWAAYKSGSGTTMLEFAYTVENPNISTQGIKVVANSLELNGGTIGAAGGGSGAALAHVERPHNPEHKVDWRVASDTDGGGGTPTVSGVTIASDPGADDTYGDEDEIRIRVTFSEPVDVDTSGGKPRLKIRMDPNYGDKWADYKSGSGTTMLEFAYTVENPNISTQGIKVVANSLELNGGTIGAAGGGSGAALAHVERPHNPAHKVDWRVASDTDGGSGDGGNTEVSGSGGGTPTVSGVAIASDPGADDTYGLGDTIRVRVAFSEAVAVTGSPRLTIDMSPENWGTKHASYASGTGTAALVFAYTVAEPNYSPHGIKVVANSLSANGGTIASASSGTAADLAHDVRGHDPGHKVDWRPSISVADASAREGTDANAAFTVSLSRAFTSSGHTVTVGYATSDGTATAGADYTATSGTLTFAAGETTKTVNVPILDDAVDEGSETFTFRLSNVVGAHIADGEATGTITNSDPLQQLWLSRFGRTVASHVTDAVSDRLSTPLSGAQVTVGGERVDLAGTEDEAWLGEALTSVARALGASEQPAPGDDPDGFGAGLGLRGSPALDGAPVRDPSGRELLLGSAFHLARDGEGGAPGLAAWGRVTVGGFDGEERADDGNLRIDGEVTTGILGADATWHRLLAGVAVSVSEGEGTFSQPGVDSGTIESTMTTVSPYARLMVNDRLSVWGLAGWGTGDMTIVQAANGNQAERVTRTDLEMRLVALGSRGALMQADETGGIDLALRSDTFWVETESQAVSNEGSTTANASRVRLALEGSRAFGTGDGGTLTPGVELGLRHDGGDAETGSGVEFGGRVVFEDPATGLGVEGSVRALIAHEDSDYREWGASGAVRLAPDERGRGLSFSLSPTYGAASSGVDRLWGARDARGLAPGHEFEAGQRLQGELGYGMSLLGDRFTGTPNLGVGLSDGARDWRIGWRLTSAVRGDPGFEVNLDATRREAVNDNEPAEHGVMLRGAIRW